MYNKRKTNAPTMNLTTQDIINMASCSLSEVNRDFVYNGDTFVLMGYKISDKRHFHFEEYGFCSYYQLEPERSIEMKYLSLESFPPMPKTLALQATQIVQGRFISSDGLYEVHIKKLSEMFSIKKMPSNIVSFPKRETLCAEQS